METFGRLTSALMAVIDLDIAPLSHPAGFARLGSYHATMQPAAPGPLAFFLSFSAIDSPKLKTVRHPQTVRLTRVDGSLPWRHTIRRPAPW